MPTVHFMGYVEPRESKILVENLTPIWETNIVTNRITKFTVAIADSVVSVECEMEDFHLEEISQLYTRSVELSRTLVNLIAVRRGLGFTVHLDTLIRPDGTEERLCNHADCVIGLIDEYDLNDIDSMFQKVACNVDLTMALNDMMDAITRPRTTAVNCARTIDSIKGLLAPGRKDKNSWRIVHEKLKVDEDYLQHISKQSSDSRHGKHSYISVDESEELLRRTWRIFNRYLYQRDHPLEEWPSDRFPQLTTAPMPQA